MWGRLLDFHMIRLSAVPAAPFTICSKRLWIQNPQCSTQSSPASTQYLRPSQNLRENSIGCRWQEIPRKWQWPKCNHRTWECVPVKDAPRPILQMLFFSSPSATSCHWQSVDLYNFCKTSVQLSALIVYFNGLEGMKERWGKRLEENSLDGRWSKWEAEFKCCN